MRRCSIEERMKKNSVYAYLMTRPEPDLTEVNRLADEFLEEMRIAHKKERQFLQEAKSRGEI